MQNVCKCSELGVALGYICTVWNHHVCMESPYKTQKCVFIFFSKKNCWQNLQYMKKRWEWFNSHCKL